MTGNPYSEDHLNRNWFEILDEVWKYAWDTELGTVRPRSITDRAINASRDRDSERLIIHYLQPHFPSIPEPLNSGIDIDTFGEGWDSVWDQLRSGKIESEVAWNSYEANLRHVLDDVDLLLDNLSSDEVIITADHGNAFGEWGLYGHPPRTPVKTVREVPWVSISATDTQGYEPSVEPNNRETAQDEVEDRLADLGYL